MRVVSLINSNMICETSSIYALHYAKSFSLKLSLVHIKENDKLSVLDKVFADIKRLAAPLNVELELIIYESLKELEQLILVYGRNRFAILVPFPIILLLSQETYKYFRLEKLNLTDE